MIKPEDITIIIPHLGNSLESEYALDQCLDSLYDFKDRIIVVHNGINDCKHHDECSIHINEQGQCRAVNAAIATTKTEWIMVTNDDMVYPPGWFEKLVDFPDGYQCISPKLVEPRSGAPTFETYFCGGAGGDFDRDKFFDYVKNYSGEELRTGFNLPFLIKRKLWDTVGGYDVSYDPFSSNSDSDLEYKIRLAGVQPMQNTKCLVYHFSQTSGTFSPENQSYWNKNWEYFIKKWGFPRTDNGIWEANFEIPDLERLYWPEWEGKYDH